MSIPGVGPSIAGQGAQEAILSLCGRFVNLFQYRVAAVAALALTSFVGLIAGLYTADFIVDTFKKKNVLYLMIAMPVMTTLNVIVAKCLKLPFSPLASAGVATGLTLLILLGLAKFGK